MSWTYVISLPFVIAIISTFLLSYTIPPILARTYFKKELTFEQRKSYFTHMVMGTIHSIFAVALCFYLYVTDDMGNNLMYSKSKVAFVLLQFSFGFYMADIVVHSRDNILRYSFPTYAHHGIVSLAIFFSLYYQGASAHFGLFRLPSHITNPFIYVQYILIRANRRQSLLYTAASIGMTVTTLLTRVLPLYWIWKIMINGILLSPCTILPLILRLIFFFGSLIFDAVTVVICYRMVKGSVKHIMIKTNKHS